MITRTRNQPYIGVSGVVNPEQQMELVEYADDALKNLGRKLALGVKATHKSQYSLEGTKYGSEWFHVGDEISGALDLRVGTWNILQTYLSPEELAKSQKYPQKFFKKLQKRTSSYSDAVQIDMLRYEADPERYRHVVDAMALTGLDIIIQCHGHAMESGPKRALESMKRLIGSHTVSYILFDASHGNGKQMDNTALMSFLQQAYNDRDFLGRGTNFGIAGGLHGDNVAELLDDVLIDFPEVSWDAEGRLHNKLPSDGGNGRLDMGKTKSYLQASIDVLSHRL